MAPNLLTDLFLGVLYREIGSLDPQDMSRDTSGTRALATFVAEIGERLPDIVLSIISSLLPHLDGEVGSLARNQH